MLIRVRRGGISTVRANGHTFEKWQSESHRQYFDPEITRMPVQLVNNVKYGHFLGNGMKLSEIQRMQQLAGITIIERWEDEDAKFSMPTPLKKSISADDHIFRVVYELQDSVESSGNAVTKVKEVPVSELIGTEKTLDPENVRYPRNNKPPSVVEYRGNFYVTDGNHRVAHAALAGHPSIKCVVMTIPPKMEMYTFIINDRFPWYYGVESEDELWPILRKLESGDSQKTVTSILNQEGVEIY